MKCCDTSSENARLAALHRYNILDSAQEESFERITRLAKAVVGTPIVLVSLIDRDRQWFKSKLGLDLQETPRDVSFCTYAIQQNSPLIVTDAREHPVFCKNPFVTGAPHIRFYIGIPLKMHDGHSIGTLCAIDTRPRDVSAVQIEALQDLARLVVNEIELRQIATIDSLTGTLTRRGFEIEINREVRRTRRYHRNLSVIAVDIDHFKTINDRYGHAAGDLVLQTVAAQIKHGLRPSDFVGRLGGEEFVVVLPETGLDGARILAERIRADIAGAVAETNGSKIGVTASLGISICKASDTGWKPMVKRADAALYEAKQAGRNRAVCCDADPAFHLVA